MSDAPHYFLPSWVVATDEAIRCDVCVYGGTAAGVVAAVAAARVGKSVVLLQRGTAVGGMTTGGLGLTDYGHKAVIGGMSRQFYRDLGAFYGRREEWVFEPHAAAAVFARMLTEARVPVRYKQFLRAVGVTAGKIESIAMLGGLTVRARAFIDATYEGDLMALAGVDFHVGRESNRAYGETINGVQVRDKHQFTGRVDPYVKPGDPASGLLPGINPTDVAPPGSGDGRVQAYNFRLCMCDDPANRIPWQRPDGYDPAQYVLAGRWYNAAKDAYNDPLEPDGQLRKFDRLAVASKTDTNNHGAVSSDWIGNNHQWPEGDYALRERLFQAHRSYQQGLYWFLANDESIPDRYRQAIDRWGLARDEFVDTGGWPHQLYVREARRMVGAYVLTEADAQHHRQCTDPVGMGSYALDSHNCQRFVRDGAVCNEGDVQLQPAGPYAVSYRSIVPRPGQCPNLLVPVCLSASHIAYGSVRMEPVFMVLAESAAAAACLAIDGGTSVQDVDYAALRRRLDKAGQVLEL